MHPRRLPPLPPLAGGCRPTRQRARVSASDAAAVSLRHTGCCQCASRSRSCCLAARRCSRRTSSHGSAAPRVCSKIATVVAAARLCRHRLRTQSHLPPSHHRRAARRCRREARHRYRTRYRPRRCHRLRLRRIARCGAGGTPAHEQISAHGPRCNAQTVTNASCRRLQVRRRIHPQRRIALKCASPTMTAPGE